MYLSLFIHSPNERHFGCFQALTVINCYKYSWVCFCVDISLQLLWGNTKHMISFARNFQIVLESGCTISYSYQWRMRVPVASHPCQHLACQCSHRYHEQSCEVGCPGARITDIEFYTHLAQRQIHGQNTLIKRK